MAIFYPTPVLTRTFRIRGTATLNYAGGTAVDERRPAMSGGDAYIDGSGFRRYVYLDSTGLWQNGGEGEANLSFVGFSARIHTLARYREGFPGLTGLNVPQAVTQITYSDSVSTDVLLSEWIYEDYSAYGTPDPSMRQELVPSSPSVSIDVTFDVKLAGDDSVGAQYNPADDSLVLKWEVTSDVTLVLSGSGFTDQTFTYTKQQFFGPGLGSPDPVYITTNAQLLLTVGGTASFSTPDGIPSNAVYIQASGVSFGPVGAFRYMERLHEDFPGGAVTRTYVDGPVSSADLHYEENDYDSSVIFKVGYPFTLNGTVLDFTGVNSGIVGRIVGSNPNTLAPVTEDRLFTSSQDYELMWGGSVQMQLAPPHFDPANTTFSVALDKQAAFRFSDPWDGLSLDRATSVPVGNLSDITPGTYAWMPTNATVGYASSTLTVTGTGTDPSVKKTLKSVIEELKLLLVFQIDTWITTNTAFFSAEELAYLSRRVGGAQRWYMIGKALPGYDEHNWSSYRSMRVFGYADVACAVTMKVVYNEVSFNVGTGVGMTETPKTVEIPLSFGTDTAGSQLVDLAAYGGHYGFRYVVSVEFLFPTGRTISIKDIVLEEQARPVGEIHQNSHDFAALGVYERGKACLWCNVRDTGAANSVWGWQLASLTLDDVAASIGLQLGFTASVPSGGSNPAVWLLPDSGELSKTFAARRSFGSVSVPPVWAGTLDFDYLMGQKVMALIFKDGTEEVARARVKAYDEANVLRGFRTADSYGAASIPIPLAAALTVYASQGKPEETSVADTVPEFFQQMTLFNVWLTGVSETVVGFPIDTDFIQNLYGASVSDPEGLRILGRLGSATDWAYNVVDAGIAWVNLSVCVSDTLNGQDRIVAADDGTDTYLFYKVAGVRTAVMTLPGEQYPSIEYDATLGQLFIATWIDDTIYFRKTRDLGDTWILGPVTMLADVPAQQVNVRRVGKRLVGGFMTSDLEPKLVASDDEGRNWTVL